MLPFFRYLGMRQPILEMLFGWSVALGWRLWLGLCEWLVVEFVERDAIAADVNEEGLTFIQGGIRLPARQ